MVFYTHVHHVLRAPVLWEIFLKTTDKMRRLTFDKTVLEYVAHFFSIKSSRKGVLIQQ